MKYKDLINIELINKMTLEEKASLLSGKDFWMSKTIERLEIPQVAMADGPHGIRRQADEVDHLGLNAGLPATSFPTAATVANSWDEELAEKIGRMLGEEAVAQKVSVVLGPGLNIKRSPLCGRNFEYFSEDPYLAGKLAAGYIRGIQSNGISACPKHFAVNNQELLRMTSDSVLDERTLRELYLTGFEIAVKEGKPHSIMSSYNRINGIYANENPHLLQEILVDEWGFNGFVVTDWGGSNDHVEGIKAGSHLEMPANGGVSDLEVIQAIQSGSLSMEVLDQRVDEFLHALSKIKSVGELKGKEFNKELHHDMAREAAEKSIVLLKNENNILPLKVDTKVAVIGDFAVKPRYQGAGSSMVTPTKMDSAMAYIEASHLDMIGYVQGFERNGKGNETMKNAACAIARNADVVLLYLGLDESAEAEGIDRNHMRIHDNQIDLLETLVKINENIVVVLSCGSVVEMPWIDNCNALVYACLPGQAGAGAIVNVITGKVCPSGKLSESYPMLYVYTPAYSYFPGCENTSEYREGLYVGYRYYERADVPVRFPFGFGLSYTEFTYSDLDCSSSKVSFTLTNTGGMAGAEVTQLYIGALESEVFRPKKELKGFTKVLLEPGESRRIDICLDDKAFRYFNVLTDRYETEGGGYQIYVGASSDDIRLTGSVEMEGTDAPQPYDIERLQEYYSGQIKDVPDRVFEALIGRSIPNTKWDRKKLLGRNDTLSQLFYAKSLLARVVYKVMGILRRRADKKGKPDLNILYIYNMPFRAIAKMAGGAIDMKMVDNILEIVNGHFFRGLGHLITSWFRRRKDCRALALQLKNTKQEGEGHAR